MDGILNLFGILVLIGAILFIYRVDKYGLFLALSLVLIAIGPPLLIALGLLAFFIDQILGIPIFWFLGLIGGLILIALIWYLYCLQYSQPETTTEQIRTKWSNHGGNRSAEWYQELFGQKSDSEKALTIFNEIVFVHKYRWVFALIHVYFLFFLYEILKWDTITTLICCLILILINFRYLDWHANNLYKGLKRTLLDWERHNQYLIWYGGSGVSKKFIIEDKLYSVKDTCFVESDKYGQGFWLHSGYSIDNLRWIANQITHLGINGYREKLKKDKKTKGRSSKTR